MLDIVPSSNPVQYQWKLIMQSWEKGKKTNFGTKFGGPNFFLWVLPLLDVRHCHKLSSYSILRKTYDPNSRKWWKASFWDWCRPIGPKFGPPKFYYSTSSYTLFQTMQFEEKLKNQIWENGKKPNCGPDFHLFGPNLGPKIFFVSFTSTRC